MKLILTILLINYSSISSDLAYYWHIIKEHGSLFGQLEEHPGVELPLESKLAVQGRKSIGVNVSGTKYFTETGMPPSTTNFNIDQQLQVRLNGTVAKRVSVNVDYDDTKSYEEQQTDISVVYQGEGEEFIQRAAFGDISLNLPNTEFTGYNKKMFGAEIKAKLGKLNLTAIGSQTRGKTKTVVFTGRYTQVKKDILDTEYIRRKYYTIYLDPSHLPITPGSEQIWIDDNNGTNNSNTPPGYPSSRGDDPTMYTQPAGPYYFDFQRRGTNYVIDYTRGIITFKNSIPENYIIVVAYKYNNGLSSVGYTSNGDFDFTESTILSHAIQKDPTDTSHQLKNYYYLGNQKIVPREYDNEFVFQIFDSNNQEIDINRFKYNIDTDFGILEIKDANGGTEPFAKDVNGVDIHPNAYELTNPQSRYRMHIEYKYRYRDFVLPDRPIVKYHEKVILDGVELKRDEDYFIDYTAGFIFFANPERIKDDSIISITYEVLPFGGQMQTNLLGIRGELPLSSNFSLGGTFLYNGNITGLDVPSIESTPRSLHIFDIDGKLSITQEQIKQVSSNLGIFSFLFPSNINISGEIARSIFNPNIYDVGGEKGVAFIDSMEGIDEISSVSTSKFSWFYSSRPSHETSLTKTNRGGPIKIDEMIDFGHDTSSIAGKKQLLKLEYNLAGNSWDALATLISKSGADYTQFNYIEIWMKTDWTQDAIFGIDFGIVNEDTNENGKLDTEDTNYDNQLNPGEDNGIKIMYNGEEIIVGNDNNKLDSEDLDRNGRLDQTDSYYSYSFNLSSIPTSLISRDLGEWKLLKIPITNFSPQGLQPPTDRRLIKHFRIWIKANTSISNSITIESIQATGNKWVVKGTGLAVKAVSLDTDTSYVPLIGSFYRIISSEAEKNREKSLSLAYKNTNEDVYARRVFPWQMSLYDYSKIRFDIYKKQTYPDDVVFIRIGADENNYFQYNIPITSIESLSWQTIDIPLDGSKYERIKKGAPVFHNIKEIHIGVKSSSNQEGEIWINNLRATEVKKIVGDAKRINGSISYPFMQLNTSFREVDSKFRLIDDQSTNTNLSIAQSYFTQRQTIRNIGIASNVSIFPYLPFSFSYNKDEVFTHPEDRENPVYAGVPDKETNRYSLRTELRILEPFIISAEGNHKQEEQKWLPTSATADNTKNVNNNINIGTRYSLPNKIFSIPIGTNNIEASFGYTEDKFLHTEKKDIRDTFTFTREQNIRYTGSYQPINNFNINSSFSNKFVDKKGAREIWIPSMGDNKPKYVDEYEPQIQSRSFGMSVSYPILDRMLTPSVNYNGDNTRDFLRDELRTNSSLGISSGISPSWFSSFNLNFSHRISSNAYYQKISSPSTLGKTPLEALSFWDIWWISPNELFAYNSSKTISDTFDSRLQILPNFTITPQLSFSWQRNQQQSTTTKNNTISAGGYISWSEPGFFKSWLHPTQLNINYRWTNTKNFDANDKIAQETNRHDAGFTIPFRPTDGLSGSINMNMSYEIREQQATSTINRSYSPSIEINQDLFYPGAVLNFWPLKGVKLDQAIRMQYRISSTIVRNESITTTSIIKNENETYNGTIGIQYTFSKYVRMDINGGATYFNDRTTIGKNYISWNVGIRVNGTF
jgi:hypothetical protein